MCILFIRGVYISRWRVSRLLYLLIKYFMVAGSKVREQLLLFSAISTISLTSCLHPTLPFPIFYPVSYLFSSSCYDKHIYYIQCHVDKLYILYTCMYTYTYSTCTILVHTVCTCMCTCFCVLLYM